MLSGEVRIEGLEEFERKLTRALESISDSCGRAVDEGTKAGVAAVATDPKGFKSQTGTLAKSGKAHVVTRARGGASGYMRWMAPYALFVERGTVAHEIHPRLSAAGPLRGSGTRATQKRRPGADVGTSRIRLRFAGPAGWIFANYIKHPGTKATNFTDQAVDACIHTALEEVAKGVARAQTIMRGGG